MPFGMWLDTTELVPMIQYPVSTGYDILHEVAAISSELVIGSQSLLQLQRRVRAISSLTGKLECSLVLFQELLVFKR